MGNSICSLIEIAFEGAPVRSAMVNGAPVWVGKDACAALGISKYRDALAQLDEDERVSIVADTLGGRQKLAAITEEGIYGLLLIAPAEIAKRFRRFLKHEVLPTLRKTGAYEVKKTEDWSRLRHKAAATFKVMAVALEEGRKELGKETERHHYMNEAKLVNWAVFGSFASVDRDSLHPLNLDLLAAAELRNTLLIARGYAYDLRKPLLKRFVEEERARLTPKLEARS